MKIRIFTTALMVLLTTGLFATAADDGKKHSTALLAYTTASKISHEYSVIPVENSVVTYSTIHAGLLENWISSREFWEQVSPESETMNVSFEKAGLDEWVAGREAWERESEPAISTRETVSLEEWISGREVWEQEGKPSELTVLSYYADFLETWISERDGWEQK